jgi:rubrerythrin
MSKNYNLPPGVSESDPVFQDDQQVECIECGHVFNATPKETVCPRCQNKEDQGDE